MGDPVVIPEEPRKKNPWDTSDTSTISGSVTIGNSQPVSGVTVTVTGTGTTDDGEIDIRYSAQTTNSGAFSFVVPLGTYTVSPTVPTGYRIVGKSSCPVTVSAAYRYTVSFTVEPATPPTVK